MKPWHNDEGVLLYIAAILMLGGIMISVINLIFFVALPLIIISAVFCLLSGLVQFLVDENE